MSPIYVVMVITFLKTADCIWILPSAQRWINATSVCKLAGSSVFFDQEDDTHKPDIIMEKCNISLDRNSLPAWIYAYQQVSDHFIAYRGCYNVSHTMISQNRTTLNYSGPTECYKYCRSKFALQDRTCYCVNDDILFRKTTRENDSGICNIKCRETPFRCGGRNTTYSFYDRLSHPKNSDDENCLVWRNSSVYLANCNNQHHCICLDRNNRKREIPKLSWDACLRNCSEYNEKPAVLPPNINLTNLNYTYWAGHFKVFFYEWNKELPSLTRNIKCLALNRTRVGKLEFVLKDCNMTIKALCLLGNGQTTPVRGPSIDPMKTTTPFETTTTTSSSSPLSSTSSSSSSSSTSPSSSSTTTIRTLFEVTTILSTVNDGTTGTRNVTTSTNAANKNEQKQEKNNLFLIVPLSVGGVILLIVIIAVVVYMRRKRDSVKIHNTKQEHKTQTDSTLYSEPSIAANGGSGGTRTMGTSMEMKTTNNEENSKDYDHLHSKRNYGTPMNENKGLYDHTGINMTGGYDRVVFKQKYHDEDVTYDHTGPDMNQEYSTPNIVDKYKTGPDMKKGKGVFNDDTYDHTVPQLKQGNNTHNIFDKDQEGSDVKSGKGTPQDDTHGYKIPDVNQGNGTPKNRDKI